MKLTKRQKEIVEIVKKDQPVSGEKISELLDVSRATLRSDLSFLTLVGILKASPKVGYTYSGSDLETLFSLILFRRK
ncbi:HTH domain protein [Streptococcus constellatus subsp. pharyngis SK1060 = CCUG 46377]|uniref:HTH domain protein n=1 Tax=Streptococcus constellatus subsp. pharyngis SK1060 = CCUG 46377 TaxID=1035184 RepID=F9P6N0_STRCV|nr:HTH domain protein [Streptococcus constellatus subsp. pharyngis SK1060 = CCUG 46377]